jgi:trimeric autotransporter adhesin
VADRYWVGGTALWDGTAGAKWSTTSGGGGGASVPTTSDAVFFTNLSTGTCTIATGNTGAQSITCTGFAGTLAGTANITVAGSITLAAGMTYTATGIITLTGTGTLTTAGKQLAAVTINGIGITVTVSGTLASGSTLTLTQGTFDANNNNINLNSFISSNSNTRTLTMGSGTWSISGAGTIWTTTTTAGLTFNANTSTIRIPNASNTTFAGGGLTYHNLTIDSSTAGTSTTLNGQNTFNNLTINAPSSTGVRTCNLGNIQTINGTFSTTGTTAIRRVLFSAVTPGLGFTVYVNSTPSLTNIDFRDIYVVGTAAPISGTRIGNRGNCTGITFSAPKTVYWNLAGTQNWSSNGWAPSSGGTPDINNFPLPQDTAIIDNAGAITTLTLDTATPYVGTVDMSNRTTAVSIVINATTIYGSWINGSGTSITVIGTLTFEGGNTHSLTSAGKIMPPLTVSSYGGTLNLADAVDTGSGFITVTNGTFTTNGYAVSAGALVSNASNVRTINLGASVVTLIAVTSIDISINVIVNLTFNAGTSQINISNPTSGTNFNGGGLTYYNVSFTSTGSALSHTINGINTFNNLSFVSPAADGISGALFSANQTINGTLTCNSASAVRRVFLFSNTVGTQRTLTVNSLSATDCDFRDIAITGAAINSSPTRAGNCGGNSGIIFPTPKTVYWNLGGSQSWSATAWAPSSGGTPNINNFPLAQDTAVIDDAGAAGTILINFDWNMGTLDFSARTTAVTLNLGSAHTVYGNWTYGTGVTVSNTGVSNFSGSGTQTITSAGKNFASIVVNTLTGTVNLADDLTVSAVLNFFRGTFNAVTYNVTIANFTSTAANTKTLSMGSGLWTITGTGNVWNVAAGSVTFFKGTANIVLSNTSTSSRNFVGAGLSYNKLTIGGTTGTSTLAIIGDNQFTELASTKTVAHTISLGTTTQVFGAWTVSGTAGNVVTVTGTGTSHVIAGARVSGVDYLAMGTIGFSTTASYGEFYAGANSTGTNATIIKTAAPAPVTRYWRGGTGTWNATTTTNWSASSGGSGGASVPTSADAVIFDSASNATDYTVTCTAAILRCGSFTMSGPASGNVTWAGTAPLTVHDNFTLSATGITRTFTGSLIFSGSATGKTITTNGVALASNTTIDGVGCGWTLGNATSVGVSGSFATTNGAFDTNGYSFTTAVLFLGTSFGNTRSINLRSSTVSTFSSGPVVFQNPINLTFDAGTSTINSSVSSGSVSFPGAGFTYYNVSFTSASMLSITFSGVNTFNDLTIAGRNTAGLTPVTINNNMTINGTFSISSGGSAANRISMRSTTPTTGLYYVPVVLTCNAATFVDTDFIDITIAGAAAPVTTTRGGDCKGNSGITFPAPKTVYWNLVAGGNWSAIAWAPSSGGTPADANFPLAQDTAIIENTGLTAGNTITLNVSYNLGTIDFSNRTNAATFNTSTTIPNIYGNWTNGSGITLATGGLSTLTYSGRNTQTITSAGKNFPQSINIASLGGTVQLADAFTTSGSSGFSLFAGTFNTNSYAVSFTNTSATFQITGNSVASGIRAIDLGSSILTISGSGTSAFANFSTTGLTGITGTGAIINMTSTSAKTFTGGSFSYPGITLNQGGPGTLTITGTNTLANISNSYSAINLTTINNNGTQTVSNFTATGEAGRVLTLLNANGNYIYTGPSVLSGIDYLVTQGRFYGPNGQTSGFWYGGTNSVASGSLGWVFTGAVIIITGSVVEAIILNNAQSAISLFNSVTTEPTTLNDIQSAAFVFDSAITEPTTLDNTQSAILILAANISEPLSMADTATVLKTLFGTITEPVTMADTDFTNRFFAVSVTENLSPASIESALSEFFRSVAENTTLAETETTQANFNSARTEPFTVNDVVISQANFAASITENSTEADIVNAVRQIFRSIVENSGVANTQAAQVNFNASRTENFDPTSNQSVQANFNSQITENLVVLDTPIGRGWFRVVDSQTVTWTAINNGQSVTWQNVGNDQNPNWVVVNNSQE